MHRKSLARPFDHVTEAITGRLIVTLNFRVPDVDFETSGPGFCLPQSCLKCRAHLLNIRDLLVGVSPTTPSKVRIFWQIAQAVSPMVFYMQSKES